MLLPTLSVEVALEALLHQSILSSRQMLERLQSTLIQRLDDLLRQLGVPGSAELRITVVDSSPSDSLPISLEVNNHHCDYTWKIIHLLYSYVSGVAFDKMPPPQMIAAELRELSPGNDGEDAQNHMIDLICSICIEAIKLQPMVVLGHEQLTTYRDQLIACSDEADQFRRELTPERLPSLPWLKQVLGFMLEHKLSIALTGRLPGSKTVGALLLQCWRQGMPHIYAAEELMDALVPNDTKAEIHFAPGFLREVTESHEKDGGECFLSLRQAIYDEFGVSLPRFKFVENQALNPRSFALKVHAQVLKPWVGLLPSSGTLTTREQIEYIVRALDEDLRSNLCCLFPRWYADHFISELEQTFPTLVRIVRERFNQTQRVRVLRGLLADHISLRNLRSILERMLDYESDPDDLDQFELYVRAGGSKPLSVIS